MSDHNPDNEPDITEEEIATRSKQFHDILFPNGQPASPRQAAVDLLAIHALSGALSDISPVTHIAHALAAASRHWRVSAQAVDGSEVQDALEKGNVPVLVALTPKDYSVKFVDSREEFDAALGEFEDEGECAEKQPVLSGVVNLSKVKVIGNA